MFEYQKWHRFFAQIAGGCEKMGVEELKELGATAVKSGYRGVYFEADAKTLYTINYCSRLITKIIAPIKIFECHSTKYLYKTASQIDWSQLLAPDRTFAIFASVSHSAINHSQYAALCLKDAIVDYFTAATGVRPSVDTENPDIWFNLHIQNNKAVIGVDTSGGSLHKRGYRLKSVEAPMQETLAATIVRLTGWDGTTTFYDPCCGSGTLLCEAAMHYGKIPSGYLRKRFGFEQLPDFEKGLWRGIRRSLDSIQRPIPQGLICGSDISGRAVSAAAANCKLLPSGDRIALSVKDLCSITSLSNCTIVCNPPYGVRMGSASQAAQLYKSLAELYRNRCTACRLYVYLGDPDCAREFELEPVRKIPLVNGSIKGVLAEFSL
ncbi:MAG: hypothetical protein JW795_13400 [Chitinivibrionales bacterium]|nr:hypothetical protein [Chitinivibrionales bacterium]